MSHALKIYALKSERIRNMCYLYYHLQQKIYLAQVKTETKEAERLSNELSAHVGKCAECNGLNVEPLANNLFGQSVKVGK